MLPNAIIWPLLCLTFFFLTGLYINWPYISSLSPQFLAWCWALSWFLHMHASNQCMGLAHPPSQAYMIPTCSYPLNSGLFSACGWAGHCGLLVKLHALLWPGWWCELELFCFSRGRMGGWKEEELRQLNRLEASLNTVNPAAPSPFTLLPTRQGALPLHVSSPSTCTRAWASMLPAGVLLTQRYQVPSYTSTLLMRKVPFLETSNRESCSTQDMTMRGLSMNPHQHHPEGNLWRSAQRGAAGPTTRSNPHSHLWDEHLVSVPDDCGFWRGLG